MTVLLPPGMGDQHWIMLKMQSMTRVMFDGREPEFWVWQPGLTKKRTEGYLRRLPFGSFGGFWDDVRWKNMYRDIYARGKHIVKRKFAGFDYVLGFNRPLELGRRLEDILPGCPINWDYPVEQTPVEAKTYAALQMSGKRYIATFFCGHGFYNHWTQSFNINRFLADLSAAFPDHEIVLTGREWDEAFNRSLNRPKNVVDLTGQTDLDQLFALIRTADAFVGFAAGNGMMAQHLGTPTLLLWHQIFNPRFWTSWVSPEKQGTVYRATDVVGFDINKELEWLRHTVHSQ